MKIFIALLGISFSFISSAQSRNITHTSSSLGSQARYEIIQSTLAARWTFRLDRVCGNVSQIVTAQSENMTFERTPVIGLPKCAPDGKIRYQIFTSGIAAMHTYLLNTDTGKAWQLQSNKDKDGNDFIAWVAFDD
jgi:hypothetical protein